MLQAGHLLLQIGIGALQSSERSGFGVGTLAVCATQADHYVFSLRFSWDAACWIHGVD